MIVKDSRPEGPEDIDPTSEQTAALIAATAMQYSDFVYVLGLLLQWWISEALNLRWADWSVHAPLMLAVRKSKTDEGRRTIGLTP